VVNFDQEGVREVIRAEKAGKMTRREASRAIADLVQGPYGPVEDAIEFILEEYAKERSENHERAEA
jgi:hypothetical protein